MQLPEPTPSDPYPCSDCGTATTPLNGDGCEYYMVADDVWLMEAAAPPNHVLCIGCLEQRIGRQLDLGDFTDAPINYPYPWQSPRLRERLGGVA